MEHIITDDDRIVSHDASRLGLYYHCVRDVIIFFTLSGWNHGVLSCLSEWITDLIAWLCFQGYRFNLYSLRFQWEFCRYSEGCYFRFVGLSRSTYKLCGNHMQTKKTSSSPTDVANLPVDELFAGVRSPELIRILMFFLWYHGTMHLKILRLFQAC